MFQASINQPITSCVFGSGDTLADLDRNKLTVDSYDSRQSPTSSARICPQPYFNHNEPACSSAWLISDCAHSSSEYQHRGDASLRVTHEFQDLDKTTLAGVRQVASSRGKPQENGADSTFHNHTADGFQGLGGPTSRAFAGPKRGGCSTNRCSRKGIYNIRGLGSAPARQLARSER